MRDDAVLGRALPLDRGLGPRYGEIEYRGGKVLQWWRGSGGNVPLSHLLTDVVMH